MITPKNKKGITGMVIFVVILAVILLVGVIMVIGSSVINWVLDEAVPELTDLGMV